MKDNSIKSILETYKTHKITKRNQVYILNTDEGMIVAKPSPKINYNKLYKYLHSRNFNYLPKKLDTERTDILLLEYQEDLSINDTQKSNDLINLVALLHSKTSYFKNITNDSYKDIYDTLKNNIYYIYNLYESNYEEYIKKPYPSPSEYLFLRNYSIIYNAINYCKIKLDEWYESIKDKNKERVALLHNNLSLDHLIKNNNEYLISWDSYTFDTPILDLYNFYKKEWYKIDFKELLNTYEKTYPLLEEEKSLLDLLISIPYSINKEDNEYLNTYNIRKLINYLFNSSNIAINN